MRFRHTALLLALAVSPLGLVGCGQPTISTPAPPRDPYLIVARAINDIQQSNHRIVDTVIKANSARLIPDTATRSILNVCLQISTGGDQAAHLLQGITTLPKTSVWIAMGPLVKTVQDVIQTGMVTIPDQNTRTTVLALLTTIQGALAVVQIQTGGQ